MTTSICARFMAATALAVAALGAASAAHARSDVYFSIGVQVPPVYLQPAPVYLQPAPVYVQPQPIFVQPNTVYVQPQPYYVQPRPVYVQPQYGYGYENGRDWRRTQWERRQWRDHHRDWEKSRGRDRDDD